MVVMNTMRFFACDPHSAGPHTIVAMREKLTQEFEPTQLEVADPMGDQSSVQIFIVSEKF